jgi:hypothetical protein
MSAVLPHYTRGPWNKQVAGLIYGGQFVVPNTLTAGTTDLTVAVAPGAIAAAATGVTNVLGVAGTDANVITTQSGGANSYGQPLIDISVLTDFCSVYAGGWDIWAWYAGPAKEGDVLVIGSGTSGGAAPGCVTGAGTGATAYFPGSSTTITAGPGNVVARCTHPGGVSSAMLTQQIGGTGAASYFLGRVRLGI